MTIRIPVGSDHVGFSLKTVVLDEEVARSLVRAFMNAEFQPEERFVRRLAKVKALENA